MRFCKSGAPVNSKTTGPIVIKFSQIIQMHTQRVIGIRTMKKEIRKSDVWTIFTKHTAELCC